MNVAWNPYARPNGSLFFDAPIESGTGWAPLYCVSPVNNTQDDNNIKAGALPAIFQPVQVNRNPIGNRFQQVSAACPNTFRPGRSPAFLRQLTFTFSIGPDF
jgi:hypothetical protein